MIGPNVGRYRILGQLGSGGMGEVFLAEDPTLRRQVALKILSDPDDRSKRRFVREAITASKLSHPNVAVVYEAADVDGVAYIAMQYVEGETLRDRLAGKRLTEPEIRQIAREVADALDDAHRHGIIHRDIKPGNIMIDHRGHVKVLDFGIAKTVEAHGDATDVRETSAGHFIGTTQYASPEQTSGHAVDSRSDIFSFGVVLYEMITGSNPFAAPAFLETVRRISDLNPPAPDTSPDLKRIVAKCLEKNPDRRYQTARDIVNDLDAIASPRQRPNRWLLHAAIYAAVVITAIAGSIWFASRRHVAPPTANIDSIAVLPFENFSPDQKNEYIGDGITEEVTNALAQLPGLKVVSRTSVFALKNAHSDVRDIAKRLGVQAVVEGSVQRASDRLRVTAQLINAADGYHLWSETYNGAAADVFSIEDRIARSVAAVLQRRVTTSLQTGPTTRDIVAYDLYLKARHEQSMWTRTTFENAITYFRAAIARDPSFAEAYAGLAETYSLMDHRAGLTTLSPAELYRLAIESANKALALNPNSAEAHAALGHIDVHLGKFDEAQRELTRAIQINPNSAYAHLWYAVLLRIRQERPEQTAAECVRARELDPGSNLVFRVCSANAWFIGDFAASADYARQGIENDPKYDEAYLLLARADLMLGKFPEAENAIAKAGRTPNASRTIDEDRALLLAMSGRRDEAIKLLREIERRGPPISQGLMMRAWAAVGNTDQAIKWVDRLVAQDPQYARSMVNVPAHPLFTKLRGDPRYVAARQKLGLPPLSDKAGTSPAAR